jgi:hypothetical protein
VLGGPYKHNRRAAGPRERRPLSSSPGQPSHAARELNQPPGGLASSGPGLRALGAFTKSYEAGTHIVVFVGRAGVEKSSIGADEGPALCGRDAPRGALSCFSRALEQGAAASCQYAKTALHRCC